MAGKKKLDDQALRAMRALDDQGIERKMIAEQFGVTEQMLRYHFGTRKRDTAATTCACADHCFRVLSKGVALCDPEDAEEMSRPYWHVSGTGYLVYEPWKGSTRRFHRLISGVPNNRQIDHKNRNRLDNRKRANLRFATNGQNQGNRGKKSGCTSRFKGVHWSEERGLWCASIERNGKRKSLGRWPTEEQAAEAYRKAAQDHFGEFARLSNAHGRRH